MENLDFKPSKTKEEFRENYKLHDFAEHCGNDLLVQWGFEFSNFGEDKRYEKLWEKGEDKPDIILSIGGKSALLDWKGKHKKTFLVNKRAVDSYSRWKNKLCMPVIIAFMVFDNYKLIDRRFAVLEYHKFVDSQNEQWDKNHTVEFVDELPKFTKDNLLEFLHRTEKISNSNRS